MLNTALGEKHGRGRPALRAATVCVLIAWLLGGCTVVSPVDGPDQPAKQKPQEEIELTSGLTTRVQRRLTDLGYQPGPIDGLMGPRTRGAIRRFQADAGLPTDGRISKKLLALLEETSELTAHPEVSAEITAEITTVPPPSYETGSRFVYADGEVETVVNVEGPHVRWRSNRGASFSTYHNFVLPRLDWRSPGESGQRVLNAAPDDLWPLKAGTEVSFAATTVVQYDERPDNLSKRHETWRCRLEGIETVSIRLGTFETQKIVCDGRADPAGTHLRRVWFYAPEIRHYVLREDVVGSQAPRRSAELLAILPSGDDWPPVARAGLGWAFQHALETADSGEHTTWKSSAVDTVVTIKPGPRVAAEQAKICRSFRQIWSRPREQRVYPGVACRAASGHWLIPGLDSGLAVAEKTG